MEFQSASEMPVTAMTNFLQWAGLAMKTER